MRILILGGTAFLGRHTAEAALARGHDLTLFNRGRTNPELFPTAEKIRGDRDGGLATLRGRRWDAVVDMCGYLPRVVRASAEMLSSSAQYTFVSSLSVYPDPGAPVLDETAAVGSPADPAVESITAETYGPLKALCERAVESVFGGRSLILRPGLLVGPHDPTHRFTYWVDRVARGGQVLAPGRPGRRVQFTDARDLAGWIIGSVERGLTGLFNATGPREAMTLGGLLERCKGVSESNADFVWVGDDFLTERRVEPYTEMPLWIPGVDDHFASGRAFEAGFSCRSVEDTIRDTLAWGRTLPADAPRRRGLAPERERALISEWRPA